MTDRDCDWRVDASCSRDPHVNSLDPWYSEDPDIEQLAVRICRDCPVRARCLREGMTDHFGIWGGWKPNERQRLADRTARASATARAVLIDRAATLGPSTFGMADPPRRR